VAAGGREQTVRAKNPGLTRGRIRRQDRIETRVFNRTASPARAAAFRNGDDRGQIRTGPSVDGLQTSDRAEDGHRCALVAGDRAQDSPSALPEGGSDLAHRNRVARSVHDIGQTSIGLIAENTAQSSSLVVDSLGGVAAREGVVARTKLREGFGST
jgi:hypothetical protein